MQNLKLYVSQVILDAKNSCPGGYLELSKRVQKANIAFGNRTVDRRKLKDIAEGKEFTISKRELVALDNYLSLTGHGLADHPLFQKQSILQGLAENEQIVFLMGAFPRDREARNNVSLWDVKAFRAIFGGLQRQRMGIQGSLQDVFFLNDDLQHNQDPRACDAILKRSHLSVCSIGSPKANIATEVILGKMFQARPFARSTQPLPFKFFWPEPRLRTMRFASAFVVQSDELGQGINRKMNLHPECMGALVVNDKVYEVVPNKRGSWDDYGVVAVQRMAENRVHLVIAGITGPTTYATAVACCGTLNAAIPQPDQKGNSAVLWAVIRARITEHEKGIGDTRYVESVEVLGNTEQWPKQI